MDTERKNVLLKCFKSKLFSKRGKKNRTLHSNGDGETGVDSGATYGH